MHRPCLHLVLWSFLSVVDAANYSPEQSLLTKLLGCYNKNARPVLGPNTTTTVVYGIELVQIINVNDRYQTIKTNVWIRQWWQNELLTWEPSDYGGVKAIRLDPKKVWTPDIVLYNSADSDSSSGVEKFKTGVIVWHNGSSAWFSPATYITTCKLDITYFPFDQQTCTLKYGSWTFDESDLDMTASDSPLFSSKYIRSSEWDLISASKKRETQTYTCCEKPLASITVKVTIRRKPLFYTFNVIAPCMIMVGMILVGFCLPPESGERITLNITVLLAMAVFIQLMADALPRNAETTPLLGKFYITIMSEIAASLVATCCVLNVHYRNLGTASGVRMPVWVDVVVLHWLAAVLCVRRPSYEFEPWKNLDVERSCHMLNVNYKSASDITMKPVQNGHAQGVKPAVRKYRTQITESDDLPLKTFMRSRHLDNTVIQDHCLKDLDVLITRRKLQRQIDKNQEKWKHAGKVVDRLFFWLFVGTIFISTIVVFKEKIRQAFGDMKRRV